MSPVASPTFSQVPEWVVAEMPPGYQTRMSEIERLRGELHSMDEIGRVLWATDESLRHAVAAVFAALKCEVESAAGTNAPLAARLGDGRRLVLVVSTGKPPIPKTHEDLARLFQAVQFAGAEDRVVLVGGNVPDAAPASRPDAVTPEALGVLERMGVNLLTTAAAFRLWRLGLEDTQKARKALERLHSQDGGLFSLAPR